MDRSNELVGQWMLFIPGLAPRTGSSPGRPLARREALPVTRPGVTMGTLVHTLPPGFMNLIPKLSPAHGDPPREGEEGKNQQGLPILAGARLHFHGSCSFCLLPVKPNQPKI